MGYVVAQIAIFLAIAAVAGIILGWWGSHLLSANSAVNCQNELTGLRRNYEDATRENHALRTHLQQVEQALRKLGTSTTEANYGEYLQTRKTLEKTRRQYENLLEKLHTQEKTIEKFRNQLHVSKQELNALKVKLDSAIPEKCHSASILPHVSPTAILPPELANGDDLTCIEGVDQTLAGKLKALGILTYRQMAEMGYDDVDSIRRIIGGDEHLPIEEWVENARTLFLEKYRQAA